uniref:G-patch domain-containing protein n=1 Tax=Stomoxys calcitrans TaxID=35570 RepID=A0A1I8PXP5_STOCA
MGYQVGQGLGKDGNGTLLPLPLEVKNDRKGLGAIKKDLPTNNSTKQQAVIKDSTKSISQKPLLKTDQKQTKAEATPSSRVCRTKYSPIRAPEPSPPIVKTNGQEKATAVQSPRTLANLISNNSCGDPVFMKTIFNSYYSEVELMQLRLEASASRNITHAENDLIDARIRMGKNEIIDNYTFEFIRSELVGWIGLYQKQDMPTPIFHTMVHKKHYITIVCGNEYAYNFLAECIDDIAQLEDFNQITLQPQPAIGLGVYCFDAIYEGIVREPEMFLIQIKKHKPLLNAELWMVIEHKVYSEEGKTYFMFLVDERSALCLNFQYSPNLCICMQNLLMRNRGLVTEECIN